MIRELKVSGVDVACRSVCFLERRVTPCSVAQLKDNVGSKGMIKFVTKLNESIVDVEGAAEGVGAEGAAEGVGAAVRAEPEPRSVAGGPGAVHADIKD